MAEYIHLFDTASEFNEAYNGEGYNEPWVSYTLENTQVNYNKTEKEKLLGTPLTFKIISAGTIVWKAQNTAYTTTIEYSTDSGETWTSITSTTGGTSISVNAGDTVQLRGDNATYCNGSQYNSFSGSTAKFEVEGNIMSLIDSTNFVTATTLASSHAFYSLFSYCTGLTSAENLMLPATTLVYSCYSNMFYGCTSLTTAPALPATTLATSCYTSMFQGCTSLTTAPELPATALTPSCYSYMFVGCTSLTTAPELPATTLASYCYEYMLAGCTSLNYIKCLATDISAEYCTYFWVVGVSSSGTFVKDSSMSSWTIDVYGIPSGWTVQDA